VLGKYTGSSGNSCIDNCNRCARRPNLFKGEFAAVRSIMAVIISQTLLLVIGGNSSSLAETWKHAY
jgi:hypothetical protein